MIQALASLGHEGMSPRKYRAGYCGRIGRSGADCRCGPQSNSERTGLFCSIPTIGDSHRGEVAETYVEGILAVVEMLGQKKGRTSQGRSFEVRVGRKFKNP